MLPPEYQVRDLNGQQTFLKTYQRQVNFHEFARQNPAIVSADPKIYSAFHQPEFTIIESRGLKKQKVFGKTDGDNAHVPESKMATLKAVPFFRCVQTKAMLKLQLDVPKSGSYDFHIQRKMRTRSQPIDEEKDEDEKAESRAYKPDSLTYDDICMFYSNFRNDVGASQDAEPKITAEKRRKILAERKQSSFMTNLSLNILSEG